MRLSPEIRGELLGDAYWLHHVAPEAPAMVHISTSRRAEIVIFGQAPQLKPPFRILAGTEFTVTAAAGDNCCTVSRFQVDAANMKQTGMQQAPCPLKLDIVLRRMASMGSQYPDAVEFLRQVERNKCLSCAVQVDALPVAVDLDVLAAAGGDVHQFKNAARSPSRTSWRSSRISPSNSSRCSARAQKIAKPLTGSICRKPSRAPASCSGVSGLSTEMRYD